MNSSSYFDSERPQWFRSYPVRVGDSQSEFLHFAPKDRLTWMDLVRRFASQGLVQTQKAAGPPRPVFHFTTVGGDASTHKEVITSIGNRKLVQPVEASRIGTSAAVPYLHAEHLLYQLYQSQGGKLPRTMISATRMSSVYDLIV